MTAINKREIIDLKIIFLLHGRLKYNTTYSVGIFVLCCHFVAYDSYAYDSQVIPSHRM